MSATTTTDAFIIDRCHTLVYHGAIDDQYGFGYSIDKPRYTYLRDALDAALAQRAIMVSATAAPGCVLERKSTPSAPTEITYHNQIARLMQRHCVECHRDGGVGPFALETYQDAVAHAPMIRDVVDRGVMPPWFAATDEGHEISPWINDRSLSASEKQQLFTWLDNSTPEGEASQSPARRSFADGWLIGKPDAIFEFPKPIYVKATGTMPYQNVVVETNLQEDRWVQAIEVKPGNKSVVHHVLFSFNLITNRLVLETTLPTNARAFGVSMFLGTALLCILMVMQNGSPRSTIAISNALHPKWNGDRGRDSDRTGLCKRGTETRSSSRRSRQSAVSHSAQG